MSIADSIRSLRFKESLRRRHAMTLLEVVVSMGLLSLLMLPVIGLLATSYKVYNSSSDRHGGTYNRQTALDAASLMIHGATRVVSARTDRVEVEMPSGGTGMLEYSRGQLSWTLGGSTQLLTDGLSDARFSIGAAAGAAATAGELLLLEVATQGMDEPTETWSSTRIWVRPAI